MKAPTFSLNKIPRWFREHPLTQADQKPGPLVRFLWHDLVPTVFMLVCLGGLTLVALAWLEERGAVSDVPVVSHRQP